MWAAAGAALVLLVLYKPVSQIWVSPRRDTGMRLLKCVLYFFLGIVVILPCLVLLTGQTVEGTPCGYYLLFFVCFWYYLGKNTGNIKGRRDMEDLIGLDSYEGVADAQDRLYESRLRLATHEEVVKSIKHFAREQGTAGEDVDRNAPSDRHPHKSAILEVDVEEVE